MKIKFLIAALTLLYLNGRSQTASQAAKIVDSIYRLPDKQLYTNTNLAVLGQLVTSKDAAFKLYYPDGNKLDSLLGKKDEMNRSSAFIVAKVIGDEEIIPELNLNKKLFVRSFSGYGEAKLGLIDEKSPIDINPNWSALEAKIKQKYGSDHAKRAILLTQMDFYRLAKDYNKLTQAYLAYVPKFSTRIYVHIENPVAWDDIFGNVTDSKLLLKTAGAYKKVLDLSGQIKNSSNYIDTYANLLYKAGKTKEAIKWQEHAIEVEPNERWKAELKKSLDKMKAGTPTWPEK